MLRKVIKDMYCKVAYILHDTTDEQGKHVDFILLVL